jgi:arsenate reductase
MTYPRLRTAGVVIAACGLIAALVMTWKKGGYTIAFHAHEIATSNVGDREEAVSAGTQPAGSVHPKAVQALREIGIEHAGRSKHADEFRNVPFDLVVTVCYDAAENCPVWLGQGKRVHLGFRDPAKATGSDAEVLAQFREVRDAIAAQVPALLRQHTDSISSN